MVYFASILEGGTSTPSHAMHVLELQETCMAKQEQEEEVGKDMGMERHATEEETQEDHGGKGRRTDGRANDEGRCVR